MADSVSKLSKDALIIRLCCSCAWGKLEQKDEKSPFVWKLQQNQLSSAPPGEGFMSYTEYIESLLPLKTPEQEPNKEIRDKYNSPQIEKRENFYDNFIKPGGPGIKLKTDFDKLMRILSLPKSVIEELGIKPHNNAENSKEDYGEKDPLAEIFADGRCQIFPSFFRMMITLKKAKREFAIVFRSFNKDLENIVLEFNKFCEGNHPCYNGKNNFPLARFDGSKGSKNYIIEDHNLGAIYRNSSDIDKTNFVLGTLTRFHPREKKLETLYAQDIAEKGVKIFNNADGLYLNLMESLKEKCAFAISDDYEFWNKYNKTLNFGKPLIIDQTDYNTLHIFFDDGITEDENCIVDVRDLIDKQSIPLSKSINKYLVKVDTLKAINDPDYFLKCIEVCEKNRADDIEKVEKGITDEVIVEKTVKTEWENLMELSDADYLRKAIYPILYPAFQLLDIERPDDPITFLSFYLLKNKNKITLPTPPAKPATKEVPITENNIPATSGPTEQQNIAQPPVNQANQNPKQAPANPAAKK